MRTIKYNLEYIQFKGSNISEISEFVGGKLLYASSEHIIVSSSMGEMVGKVGDVLVARSGNISASMGGCDFSLFDADHFNERFPEENLR